MITITPKVKPVHGGVLYIGGVEVNEDGVKNTEWCGRPRPMKAHAYIDALKLKNKLEGGI